MEDTLSTEEYEDAIQQLNEECSKRKGKNQALIKNLMESTRAKRQNWISSEGPMTGQILEKFPFLAYPKMVSL